MRTAERGTLGRRRLALVVAAALAAGVGAVVLVANRSVPEERHAAPSRSGSDEGVARALESSAASPRAGATPRAASAARGARSPSTFFAAWGSSSAQVGHERPPEGNAIGPMSFGIDGRGNVYVLDQVNGRIVRRNAEGQTEAVISLDLQTPEDIAIAGDGTMAVLDRHSGAQVAVYDAEGKRRGTLPIVGEGLADPGQATGIFVDGDEVYVERAHGELVKVGHTDGQIADRRDSLAGRPSRDGKSLLRAAILDKAAGRVAVTSIERATGKPRFRRDIQLWPVIHMILLLETDQSGTIYFAAEVQAPGGDPSVVMSCLHGGTGDVVGGAVLPANTMPEESFRDLVVLDQGGVVYALRTQAGVEYRSYDCEGGA